MDYGNQPVFILRNMTTDFQQYNNSTLDHVHNPEDRDLYCILGAILILLLLEYVSSLWTKYTSYVLTPHIEGPFFDGTTMQFLCLFLFEVQMLIFFVSPMINQSERMPISGICGSRNMLLLCYVYIWIIISHLHGYLLLLYDYQEVLVPPRNTQYFGVWPKISWYMLLLCASRVISAALSTSSVYTIETDLQSCFDSSQRVFKPVMASFAFIFFISLMIMLKMNGHMDHLYEDLEDLDMLSTISARLHKMEGSLTSVVHLIYCIIAMVLLLVVNVLITGVGADLGMHMCAALNLGAMGLAFKQFYFEFRISHRILTSIARR